MKLLWTAALALAVLPLAAQAPRPVQGTVYDAEGDPLPGAVIVVEGKGDTVLQTVTADIDGRYALTCAPDAVLKAMYVGHADQRESVQGRSQVDFVLLSDASLVLEEAVAIGYGTVKKADLTGSVTSVKMGDIRDVPVTSVDQALQGRIAGTDVMSTTGEPGATTSIRIRGSRSITASNEPLIVVDGVMDAVNDLGDLNPADIESISVLKDASATAIYGARGSNGVILVTTRAGGASAEPGRPIINFKAAAGFSRLPRKLDLMDATQFALYRNDYAAWSGINAYENIGLTTPTAQSVYPDPFALGKGTDWIGTISQTASFQQYDFSIQGGNGRKTSYYASVSYLDDEGIIKRSGMQKIGGSLRVGHQVFKWLRLEAKTRYTWRRNHNNLALIGGKNPYTAAVYYSPLIDPEDSFNPMYTSGQRVNNPYVTTLLDTDDTDRSSLNLTLSAQADLGKRLRWNSQFSYYRYDMSRFRYEPSTLPKRTEDEGGDASRTDLQQWSLTWDNTLTYTMPKAGRNHFNAMAGFTGYRTRSNTFSLSGGGYMDDAVMWNNLNAVQSKESYTASSSTLYRATMAAFARLNYDYDRRYYLTVTARSDGASNFAANRKWGFFPSAAFKWNIHSEPFLRGARNIEELSLKLSAGRTGNDAIAAYRSQAALSTTTSGYIFGGIQPVAYYPSRLESPDLTWEKTDMFNAALTGSFWNGRLGVTAETYYARTTDLLLTVQTAKQTGYASRYANIGATSNRGVELSVDSRNIVKKRFSWSTAFTISHNTQRVDDIGFEDYISAYNGPGQGYMMYGYVKGYPLNSLWGFQYAGVWHNEAEVARNQVTHAYASEVASTMLGRPIYMDKNHDGTLDRNDLCYLGNADPYLYGGLQNTLRLGRFHVGVYFAWSLGGKIYNFSELYMLGSNITNQYASMVNAWHPVRNPESNLPRAGSVTNQNVPSTLQVHDASYLRLKDARLAYTLPLHGVRWMRELTLSVSGENLYLWTRYNGFDPDVSTESENGSTLRRMDLGAYPKPRTVLFSVQLKY